MNWQGQAVRVSYSANPADADFGILEHLTDIGVVLRVRRNFPMGEAVPDDMGGSFQDQEEREVFELIPWHRVFTVRPLEPHERKARGL